MNRFRTMIEILLLIATALALASVAFRVWSYPENHTGINIFWLSPLFVALGMAGIVHMRQEHRLSAWGMTMVCSAIAAMTVLFMLNYFEILLPYETWLERGMPERPF